MEPTTATPAEPITSAAPGTGSVGSSTPPAPAAAPKERKPRAPMKPQPIVLMAYDPKLKTFSLLPADKQPPADVTDKAALAAWLGKNALPPSDQYRIFRDLGPLKITAVPTTVTKVSIGE